MTTYKVKTPSGWVYIDNQNYDARYILASSKGSNSGVASLDESGHVIFDQLPSSITGAVNYRGVFDPTEGAPSPAAAGYYYVSSRVGTISEISFSTGDWLVYTDGSSWNKIANSSASVTWNNVSNKPDVYTPDTHDNNSHSESYITTLGVTYEALANNNDVGDSANQVASGVHTHSGYQPLDGDLTAISALSGTSGLLKKTAANTWTLDTNNYLTELSTVANATNWDGQALPDFTDNELKYIRLNAAGSALEFATVSAIVDIHGEDSTGEFSTGDEVLIYDSNLGENRKILRGNFFNGLEGDYISIHGTFEETTPATNMELLVYDPSVPANRRMTRANFLDGISAVGAFTDLTDTPASYSGAASQYVRVNATGTALEFATVSTGGTFDYITRSLEGVVYETTLMYWRAPAACTIDSVSMSLSSNPSATGSYCKVQVMKNGTLETNSIFTADTPMQITESTSASNGIYTASGTLDSNQTTLEAGDVIQFRVNQADTGSADLLVQMVVISNNFDPTLDGGSA